MIDEQRRHRLFVRLEETLGSDEASTLMEHLPPVGWADVATNRDLDVVRSDFRVLRTEFQALRTEFQGFRTEFVTFGENLENRIDSRLYQELNRQLRWMVTLVLGGIGVSVAASTAIAQLS